MKKYEYVIKNDCELLNIPYGELEKLFSVETSFIELITKDEIQNFLNLLGIDNETAMDLRYLKAYRKILCYYFVVRYSLLELAIPSENINATNVLNICTAILDNYIRRAQLWQSLKL